MDKARKSTMIWMWSYVALIIIGSAPIIYYAVIRYIDSIASYTPSMLGVEGLDMLVLAIISVLCRNMPVHVREDQNLDISIITFFAMVLLKGVWAAIIIVNVSTLFAIQTEKGHKVKHLFNTPLYKTLFNNANLVLSIMVGSLAYEALGGIPGMLSIPQVLLPAIGFLLVCFTVNSFILGILIAIMHDMKLITVIKSMLLSLLPNLLATAPVGFFLAWVFTLDGGPYLSLLFIMPLLLARYTFKLYLDSKSQFYKTIKTLTAAIEAKDKYTQGHSKRVEMYAERIARAMNLSSGSIEEIKVAALLHDIGKIGIDDSILRKPGHLSKSEWSLIREHPSIGLYILEDVEMPKVIKDNILYHHVFYNGGGYPEVADYRTQVPIGAYIIAVADAYDAMTSNRPYREAMHSEQAMTILRENSGVQFHPEVVEAFERVMHS